MITKYENYCAICGQPKSDVHHLVFGIANRKLSDEDGLTIPVCRKHHELLHEQAIISKIIGQLAYERDKCAEGYGVDAARESFRQRYGKSYL